MDENAGIYVAGQNGLVGSAILRQFYKKGYTNIIGVDISKLDLIDLVAATTSFPVRNPNI